MTIDKKIAEKFNTLLAEGKTILQGAEWDGSKYRGRHPDAVSYVRFRTESLNLIKRSCGETSEHYKELNRLAEDPQTSLNSYYFAECYGALDAASRDYEGGMLFDIRFIVTAEVLDDS